MSDKTPNSSMAMLWFFLMTTVYFMCNYSMKTSDNSLGLFFYISIVLIVEGIVNYGVISKICTGASNNSQFTNAFMVTTIPWLLIFAVFTLLLKIFPGWLGPFSNTFGYAVVNMLGLSKLIPKIFKQISDNGGDNDKPDINFKQIQQALAQIYGNQSLLINQITPSNFEKFWESSKILIQEDVFENNPLKGELSNYVTIKNMISEYIWYILIGSIVTTTSYNFIININCNKSSAQLQSENDDSTKENSETTDASVQPAYGSVGI